MSHLDLSLSRPESLWVCCPPTWTASTNVLICIDALIKVGLPPEPTNQKLERTSALNLGLPKKHCWTSELTLMWARSRPECLPSTFWCSSSSHPHPPCLSSNLGWWHLKAGGWGEFRWTLSVFYSKSLSGGPAPAFPWSLNVRWCVVFAGDLCVGGALWFTGLWQCLGSGTREADSGSLCVFQVSWTSRAV